MEDITEIPTQRLKRKCESKNEIPIKKIANDETRNNVKIQMERCSNKEMSCSLELKTNNTLGKSSPQKKQNLAAPQSPKKRLNIDFTNNKQNNNNKNKQKFIYGNYSNYYGYRNNNSPSNNNSKDQGFHDIRLDVFTEHKDIFKDKQILDIGCNNGYITMEIAKKMQIKSIVGLDIDKGLINQAVKSVVKCKKSFPMDNDLKRQNKFPFNVSFVHGNYVLRDKVLLEIERPQFDVIMCLSLTKWIHLNFGDDGLKLAFKRMYLQLRPKGVLILEPQPYDNYGRRKKMTDTIYENYKAIKFYPKDFDSYLLSSEVGFSKMSVMGVPEHCQKGFKRPIQIFFKE